MNGDKGPATIRVLAKEDCTEAMDLAWRVFLEFEAPGYPEEGLQTFKDFIAFPAMMSKMDAGQIFLWGCYDKKKLAGIIAFREHFSHISLLFVEKEYHRQGIARRLLMTALAFIKDKTQVKEITVNSSPYAQKIYEKMGFHAMDAEQILNGIIYIPMKLQIE